MKWVCIKKTIRRILVTKYFLDRKIKKKFLLLQFIWLGLATSFVFCCFLVVRAKRTAVVDLLKQNALNPDFTGASVCGHFSCFGKSLCDSSALQILNLNSSLITATKSRISIPGNVYKEVRSRTKLQRLVFNFPMTENCDAEFCKICLEPEMFTSKSYENWICRNFGFKTGCNIIEVIHDWPKMKQLLGQTGRLNPNILKGISPPFQCASSRLADRLIRRTLGALGKGSILMKDYSYQEKAELAFTSKMSPGTVMQKMFPFYEGWLITLTLGSCGLMTVNQHTVVTTLYELYHADWKKRLDVAVQLLDIARHYSENDSKFLLLLHRLTPHDIGISQRGKLAIQNSDNIVIIDTVDPKQNFVSKHHETAYHKEYFRVNEERICQYSRTDVNYYTVCRNFLMGSWKGLSGETLHGGLLHDPNELSNFQSQMFQLLDLCNRGSRAVPKDQVKPNVPVRKIAAGHLRWLLARAQECKPEYQYRYPECELYSFTEMKYRLPSVDLKWLH